MRRDDPTKSFRNIKKRLEALEEKKEQIRLTRRLSGMEVEEAAEFPILSSLEGERPEEMAMRRQFIQESKLAVPFIKPYLGQNYAQYQNYIRAFKHVFNTQPTTYWKDANQIFYSIGTSQRTPVVISSQGEKWQTDNIVERVQEIPIGRLATSINSSIKRTQKILQS